MYRVKSVIHGLGTQSSAGNSNCSVPYEYDPNLPENKSVAQLKLDLADQGTNILEGGSLATTTVQKSTDATGSPPEASANSGQQ